jgi:hypothetical protein
MQPGNGAIELFLRLRRAGDGEVHATEFGGVVPVVTVLRPYRLRENQQKNDR